MGEPTQELANFVVRARYDDLPELVVERAKQVLLDCIGCALGAYIVDRAKIAIELVKDQGGKPEASIIGNDKTSCALAAFANGELISALDYDPVGPLTSHVCSYVIPPVLAIGERVKASGKDLITAIAIGLEVGGRVAHSLAGKRVRREEPPYYEETPRFSYSITIFGAVAGACGLLRLNEEKVANAFGIAGASTPVAAGQKWEHTSGPMTMVKFNTWSGWIAQLATAAALAAEKGFTGDTTILDGEWGFWKIYGSPFFKPDNLVGGLGKAWHASEVSFKAYPACGLNHTAIDAITKIVKENEIRPDDIESIVVRGEPGLLRPNRSGTEIKSFADTQFSNAYIFALAPYYGDKPAPTWQIPSTYEDPRIKRLMGKVRVALHPRTSDVLPGVLAAGGVASFFDVIVELTAKGRTFVAEAKEPKGSPQNPMTEEEMKEKFRNNACYSPLPTNRIDNLIQTICELEKAETVSELTELLTI